MVWFKVDDKLHSHSKVRKVLADEPAALALWVVAGSWSADNLTDGFVPDHQLPWLLPTGAAELAQKLVTARLWRRVRGGHEFHEWHVDGDGTKRNPSKEEVETDRRKKAEAGRKGGLASGKTRTKREAPASAPASANGSAPAKGLLEPPTRPDPPPSYGRGVGGARPASPGAARAPARAPLPADQDPDNPDWRALPAYGHDEPDAQHVDRVKRGADAAREILASRPRPHEPDRSTDALDELRRLTELPPEPGGEAA